MYHNNHNTVNIAPAHGLSLLTRAGQNYLAELLRKAFAFLTFGNFHYEAGDRLWFHCEFIHAFDSAEKLQSEFTEAGFAIIDFSTFGASRGGAILEKPQKNIINNRDLS